MELSGYNSVFISIAVLTLIIFLLVILLSLSIRRKSLKIIVVIILLILIPIISFLIPQVLTAPLRHKRILNLNQRLNIRWALTSYYNKNHRYPPFDGLLDTLNKIFYPDTNVLINPYNGERYTRVLPYDSILKQPLPKNYIGLFAYKVSADGQSCCIYFIDHEVWFSQPIFLVGRQDLIEIYSNSVTRFGKQERGAK